MEQIKKLVIINLILAIILPIIPKGQINIIYTTSEPVTQVVTLKEVAEVSRVEEVKNLGLALDTNLRHKSNLHATDYDTMLQGTQLYGIGSALEKAEQSYNINGLYLMGLCILESRLGH